MNPSVSTVGGGPATGLANEFTQWLSQGLTTGLFGGASPGAASGAANPFASTQGGINNWSPVKALLDRNKAAVPTANPSTGISGIVNDILSNGAGSVGGSLQKILATQQAGDVANLRSRYSMGGTGTGSPGAYAESLYRANAAPQAAMQIGQLQLSTLLPLLQMISAMAGRGVPQASTVVGPSALSQIGGLAGDIGGGLTGLAAIKKANAAAA